MKQGAIYETVRRLPAQPVSISTRYVWLTAADWMHFFDLLRQSFPEARFYTDPGSVSTRRKAEAPSICLHDHLLATEAYVKRDDATSVFPSPWLPHFVHYQTF